MTDDSNFVTLYHFTSLTHLSDILVDGYLDVTESNLSKKRERAGKDVVWLTTESTTELGLGLDGSAVDKKALRFTVRLHKRAFSKWRDWAHAHGIDPNWETTFARAGGGAGTWRVVPRRIPREEWVDIMDARTGQIYWASDPSRITQLPQAPEDDK